MKNTDYPKHHLWSWLALLGLLSGLSACVDTTNDLLGGGSNDANITPETPATAFTELDEETQKFFQTIEVAKPSESLRFSVIAFTFLSTDYITLKNLVMTTFQPETERAEEINGIYRFSSFIATVKLTDTLKCGKFTLGELKILFCPGSIHVVVALGEELISTFGEVLFSDATGRSLYKTISSSDVLTSREQFEQLAQETGTADAETRDTVEATYNDTQDTANSFQEEVAPQVAPGIPLETTSTSPANPAPNPNALVPWDPQTFAQRAYFKASNADDHDYFGISLAISGSIIAVGAQGEDSNATGVNGKQNNESAYESGAVYLFQKGNDTWSQMAYLKASNTELDDRFGRSVALAKNGTLLAVSAPCEDSSATGINGSQSDNNASCSGAVYAFRQNENGQWSQEAYLKASNTGTSDQFGNSIAFSEDGTILVVGALFEDSNATGVNGDQSNNSAASSGAAYVFVRDINGTWSQEAYLKASNTTGADQFGTSVAISNNRIVVGAPTEDSNATGVNGDQSNNNASNSGATYVFVRGDDGTWSQEAYLKASNTGAADEFGRNVSIVNDLLVIGARFEDSNATGVNGDQSNNSAGNSGAAYVFVRDINGTWSQEAYLKASNTQSIDLFGFSIAAFENGVAIGAYGEDSQSLGINGNQADDPSTTAQTGAVYVFRRQGSTWSQTLYVKPSNAGTFKPGLGYEIAISGGLMIASGAYENGSGVGVNGDQTSAAALYSGAGFVFE